MLNLFSNAIKFTPEGGRIDVSAAPKDGFVEVSVSDIGIGIAPEDQEKVFEEFALDEGLTSPSNRLWSQHTAN